MSLLKLNNVGNIMMSIKHTGLRFYFSFFYGDEVSDEFGSTPLGLTKLFGDFAIAHKLV